MLPAGLLQERKKIQHLAYSMVRRPHFAVKWLGLYLERKSICTKGQMLCNNLESIYNIEEHIVIYKYVLQSNENIQSDYDSILVGNAFIVIF